MDSAKPTMAVALADERLGKGWHRSQTRIRIVAVLCALVAAAIVFSLFERSRVQEVEAKREKLLIAAIDLRIGNPAGAAERGEAKARADIEAGLLQLQGFGPATAKAQRLKQRYGITWVTKGKEATLLTQAHADAYNRVMQAEIERRHGHDYLERLVHDSGVPRQEKKASP